MTSFRTPLNRVRGLGSAKSGVSHWWQQRATAAAGVPLVIFLITLTVSLVGADQAKAAAWLSWPPVTIALGLSFFTLLKHMRLGMQVIIEDYIHGEGAKVFVLLLNTIFTYLVGAALAYALLKLSFGA